jgi:hypothetical protein
VTPTRSADTPVPTRTATPTETRTPTPTPTGSSGACTQVDIAIVIDSSGSIDAADFDLEKEGFATAIEDSTKTPQDGSVCVVVVEFTDFVSVPVPFTCIGSAAAATSLAAQIRGIQGQIGGTGVDLAIGVATAQLSANGRPGARRVVALATDGLPNITAPECDVSAGRPVAACATCSALDNAIAAAQAAGVDELDIVAIEDPANNLVAGDFTNFYGCRVFPQPNTPGPPPEPGFVLTVGDFQEFAVVVANTLPAGRCATRIDLGEASGMAGDAVKISATLTKAAGAMVVDAGAKISFDPVVTATCGDCQINPALATGGWTLQCSGSAASGLILEVNSPSCLSPPIPDGDLFTCTFAIDPTAPLGAVIPLRNAPSAFSCALSLTAVGRDGSIHVLPCGDGVADPGEVCGEPGLSECPPGKVCDACKCVDDNCPRLTVGTRKAYAGSRVYVPVEFDPRALSVGAMNFTAEYRCEDTTLLPPPPPSCRPGPETEKVDAELTCVVDEPAPVGECSVTAAIINAAVTPVPAIEKGDVTDYLFRVRPAADASVPVCIPRSTVAFGSTTGPDVCVGPTKCGGFTVIGSGVCTQGDCNCDQAVNGGDRVCLITKFFNPSLQGTCPCEDCNLSGAVNAADAPCITLCAFGQCPIIDN